MPFTGKSGKFTASINNLTIGTGDKAITIGGESAFPFYSFDAPCEHRAAVGIEITDGGMEAEPACIRALYDGCSSVADMAAKAGTFEGVDFLSLRLEGGDPNGLNKSTDELIELVKAVAAATDLPLVITGTKNAEKDGELLAKAAEVLDGKNAVILSAREENYKQIGAAAGLAYKQVVGAESAVDINLAKQLNVLLSQLGVDDKTVIMQPGSAAAGYGFEYVVSTLDRIKAAALGQNDTTLQMPIITPVASEVWGTKESSASEEDMPAWGPVEERGIDMEIETAAAVLASGSNAVILRHPASVATIAKMVRELA